MTSIKKGVLIFSLLLVVEKLNHYSWFFFLFQCGFGALSNTKIVLHSSFKESTREKNLS